MILRSDPPLPNASEINTRRLFRYAESARQQRLCHVVAVERADVLLTRLGDRRLRLHHFDVIRDAGSKTVACLGELLRGQFSSSRGGLQLLAAGLQIEKRGSYVVID